MSSNYYVNHGIHKSSQKTFLRRRHMILVQHEINAYVQLYYRHVVAAPNKTLFKTILGRLPSQTYYHFNLDMRKFGVMSFLGCHYMIFVQHEINEYVNLYHHHMVFVRDKTLF